MAEDNKALGKLKKGALWYLGMDEKGNPDLSPDRYDAIKNAPKNVLDAAEEYGEYMGPPGQLAKAGAKVLKKNLKYAKGGTVKSSASKRADGCAQRGKTRGRMV